MNWLPSTTTRYLLLGLSLLAFLALIDGIARSVADFGGVGFAVTLWTCFGAAYAWLLLEPLIDAAMVLRKAQDQDLLDRVHQMGRQVASEFGIPAPRFCVYRDTKFQVMVVGIGRAATIFLSEAAAKLEDDKVRAILAHECGHIRLGHSVTRLALYGLLLALAMVGNSTPMVAILANIFVLWAMRQMEYAADGAAAKIVGGESVAGALAIVRDMLADVPKWQLFFSTHPTFRDRIDRLL